MGKLIKWNCDKASKGTRSGIDRISNLPGPLLAHILSLLPTKYAVATSVLSTKWRFLWTSINNLDFDDSGYFPKKTLNMKRDKFKKFVNRVLLLLNPPYIQNLCFPNLQTLHLSDIKIEIARSSVVSFPNLKILHLITVDYDNENSVQKLFSSCPVLDNLVIKRESWEIVLRLIICMPSLTRLELDYLDDRVDTLQIDNLPNLKSLLILGHSLKAIRTASLNISSGFHNLTWLEVEKKDCHDWSIVVNNLLESMDNLEHLTMKGDCCYYCPGNSWWTEPYNVPKCLLSRVTTISFTDMINECSDECRSLGTIDN